MVKNEGVLGNILTVGAKIPSLKTKANGQAAAELYTDDFSLP